VKLLYVVNITMSILIHNIVNCKCKSGNRRGTVIHGIGNWWGTRRRKPLCREVPYIVPSPLAGEGQDEGEKIVKVYVKRSLAVKARTLRRRFTDAELKLWRHLRGRQIGGEKFRRQQPLGKYVVDFVCLEKKLIVDVDGGQHAAPEYDKERTMWLESEGFQVIRFWNNEVLRDIAPVLDAIYKELKNEDVCHPHPGPLPSRERVKKING
jgi:very-short-patch-repair endonuclease